MCVTHFKKQEHIPDSSTRRVGRIQLQPMPSRTEETAGKAVTLPNYHFSAKPVALRSRIVHDKLAVLSVY